MSEADLFLFVKDGGAYCSPLLLMALYWMNKDRNRMMAELKSKSDKLEQLAERTIVIMTEFKGLLTGRKEAA